MKDAYWFPTKPDSTGRCGFRKVRTTDMTHNEVQFVLETDKLDRHKEEDCKQYRVFAQKYLWQD
jgi:hypothetical protein